MVAALLQLLATHLKPLIQMAFQPYLQPIVMVVMVLHLDLETWCLAIMPMQNRRA